MQISSYFRISFRSQRVNGFQWLQKSSRENFYPNISSFWLKESCQTSALVRSVILRPFVNPLTADTKCSRHNTVTLPQLVQMHLS